MKVVMESYLKTVPNTSKLKRHKCILCDASYDKLKDLQIHTYVHVPINPNDEAMGPVDENGLEYEELEFEENVMDGSKRVIKIAKIPVPLSAVMPIMRHECVLCEAAFDELAALQSHSYEHLPTEHEEKYVDEDLRLPVATLNKLHKCVLCTASFNMLEGLQAHSYDHLPQSAKRPQCDECGATFACSTNLSRHKHLHRDKVHKCHLCGAAFALKFKLKKHLMKHSNSQLFICEECGEAFALKYNLKVHMSCHHLERRFKCVQCDATFAQNDDLQDHNQKKHMIKIYRCKTCNFSYLTKKELMEHKSIHEPSKEILDFVCGKCGCVFLCELDLTRHNLVHTSDEHCTSITIKKSPESAKKLQSNSNKSYIRNKKAVMCNSNSLPFTCEICGKVFAVKYALKDHLGSCHLERRFKCVQCDATFARNRELQKHKKKRHMIKIYRCKLCNFSFLTKEELKEHKVIHKLMNEPLNYICDKCGCTFLSELDLTQHNLLHTNVATKEEYTSITKCLTIDTLSASTNKLHLSNNKFYVTDNKPFTCDDCGMSFSSNDNLTQHKEKSHKGRKPHKCKQCGAFFQQRSYLTIHSRIHAGQKPFKCKMCGSGFIRNGALKRHMRNHTPDGGTDASSVLENLLSKRH